MSQEDFKKKIVQAITIMVIANILLFGGGRLIDVLMNKVNIENNKKEILRVETDYKARVDKIEGRVETMRTEWREDQKEILLKIEQLHK